MRSNRELLPTRTADKKRNARRQKALRQKRRLQFESLEPRVVLACPDELVSILGTVAEDLSGDGVSPDDVGIPNVTMYLYEGGLNGVLEPGTGGGVVVGDDVLVDQAITSDGTDGNDVGYYRFNGLGEGNYFVEQIRSAGYLPHIPPGDVIGVPVSATDANGVEGTTIDPFTQPTSSLQLVAPTPGSGNFAANSVGGLASVIGDDRDLYMRINSDPNTFGAFTGIIPTSGALVSSSNSVTTTTVITYDGPGPVGGPDPGPLPNQIQYTGLGNQNLLEIPGSDELAVGIRVRLGNDQPLSTLAVDLYTDQFHMSGADVLIPQTPADLTVESFLSFGTPYCSTASDFSREGALGAADLANIGAIQLTIEGTAAADITLSEIIPVGRTVQVADS